MSDTPDIATVAALIGDRARANMLLALMSGQAMTATELASGADVTKPTASAHLRKLLDARLIDVAAQGRHRYFRLADRNVADLLERLIGVADGRIAPRTFGPRDPLMRKARVCYDHIAGELGVLAHDSLGQTSTDARCRAGAGIERCGRAILRGTRGRHRGAQRQATTAVPRVPRLERATPSPRRRSRGRAAAPLSRRRLGTTIPLVTRAPILGSGRAYLPPAFPAR